MGCSDIGIGKSEFVTKTQFLKKKNYFNYFLVAAFFLGLDLFGSSGASTSGYGAPSVGYGAPEPSYGAPAASYGAPAASYGAPNAGYDAPSSGYTASARQFVSLNKSNKGIVNVTNHANMPLSDLLRYP